MFRPIFQLLLILTVSIIVAAPSCQEKPGSGSTQQTATESPATAQNQEPTDSPEKTLPMMLSGEPIPRMSKEDSLLELPPAHSQIGQLRRTACYGRCPIYSITIYDNGVAIYHGIRFVPKLGYYRTAVSGEMIDSLAAKALSTGFYDLAQKYPIEKVSVSDFPMTITHFRQEDRENKVMNHNYNPPQSLTAFEQYIDDMFKTVEWERLSPPVGE